MVVWHLVGEAFESDQRVLCLAKRGIRHVIELNVDIASLGPQFILMLAASSHTELQLPTVMHARDDGRVGTIEVP